MTKNITDTFAMHDSLFTTVINEINTLRNDINSGTYISNAEAKLKLINNKLQKLKNNNNIINKNNTRLVLNEIDKIDSAFFDNYLKPTLSAGNFDKIAFVELINPNSLLANTNTFIETTNTEINNIIDQITHKSTNDKSTFKQISTKIKPKIAGIHIQNDLIQTKINELVIINESYINYIDDFKQTNFKLDKTYFYPDECIENEMILYSKLHDQTKNEIIDVTDEFKLITESINNMDINKNIGDLMFNTKMLEQFVGGTGATRPFSNLKSVDTNIKPSQQPPPKHQPIITTPKQQPIITTTQPIITKQQPIPIPPQQPIPIPIPPQQSIPITTKKQLKTTTTNQQSTTTNQQYTSISSVNTTNSISSGDEYYYIIMDYTAALEKLQQTFNNFKNECRKYNIYYVRMYNHILFIVNYLNLIVLNRNKNYQIYNYIGLNTISYYKEIVDNINNAMNKKTTLGKYFSKYHYINIQILYHFLDFIFKKWDIYYNYCPKFIESTDKNTNDVKKVISKLHLYNNTLMNDSKIKKSVFIFNAMKDLLDKFKSLSSPPVAVYLRINKRPSIDIQNEIFKKDKTKIGQLSNININKCYNSTSNISDIKFAEVFDSESFNDNAVLSKYMSIPTFLSQGKSIMLLTYGYSGVGKTFTVFGTSTHRGMLQTSLNNIQQQEAIYYRAYELYGMAFPYKSYWDRTPDNYYHFIYDYTKNNKEPKIYKSYEMTDFINELNKDPTDTSSSFAQIDTTNINNFQKIIDDIDNTRKKHGRIKKTINNPQSSRSIMIFDFKIKLANGKYVYFVIIDLPGKENIQETFVNNNSCIILKNNYTYLRNMAFLSPLSLMLRDDIANYCCNKYESDITNTNFIGTYLGQDYNKDILNENLFTNNIKVRGLEIMRNIINNNRFDLLSNLYEDVLFKPINNVECYKGNNYSMAPFEGYYINENIIGLLSTLLKQHKLDYTIFKEQEEIFYQKASFYKEFENLAITKENKSFLDKINNELKAQTYFFRFFAKKYCNNTYYNDNLMSYEFCGNTLENWINNTYDYNKTFNNKNPPIATLLNPYFKIIENFYVFYVVSNDNQGQCDKQIKLIEDSKSFLDELNTYPDKIAAKNTSN